METNRPPWQAIGARRPIARALDFPGLDWSVTHRRAGQKPVGEGEGVNERFE